MTAPLLFGMLVLVLVNAFFVAAEFALVRAHRARLQQLGEADAGARLALEEIGEISEYLSACQLGVTFASVGIGFLGEPAIAELIHPWLGGALSHGVALAISLIVAYVVTTALHITIGEQVPKIIAIAHAERMVRRVARPLYWFTRAFRPFVAVFNGASNKILRLLRVDPSAAFDEGATPEDLKLLITQSLQGGQLAPDEALMLSGVFELHELQARQVMTPTPRVVMVDTSSDAQTASELCTQSGHTRLLVTEDSNPDRITGVIHANSLLGLIVSGGPNTRIDEVVRDALFVPETQPLDTVLAELRRTRNSLAVVVDEYGRTAGIVSIEDIVEEIVGEIADETDPSAGPVRQLTASGWLVRGDVSLADLRDYGIDLESDTTYNSVGGLVLETLGHVPRPGERVTADRFALSVEAVRDNRVELVRISRTPADTGAGEEAAHGSGDPRWTVGALGGAGGPQDFAAGRSEAGAVGPTRKHVPTGRSRPGAPSLQDRGETGGPMPPLDDRSNHGTLAAATGVGQQRFTTRRPTVQTRIRGARACSRQRGQSRLARKGCVRLPPC